MFLAANTVLMIYLTAAVLPAIVLMVYVYKKDQRDTEPVGLLAMCLLMGVCAALLSVAGEGFGMYALNMSQIDQTTPLYVMALAFGVVAVVEEGSKLLFLYLKTWKSPYFDYKFDGIIYAVFVSLGFAAFENIKYVFSYGLSVALPRAVLAIPGHMTFAVVMGVFYGRAKYLENHGKPGKWLYIFLGWFFAVLLHGFYDTCAMLGTAESSLVFSVFIIFMYLLVFVPKYMIDAKGKTLFEWSLISLEGYTDRVDKYVFLAMEDETVDVEGFVRGKCAELGITNYELILLDHLTDGQATTALLANRYWDPSHALLVYNIDTYVEAGEMNWQELKGDGFIPCFQAPGDHWSFVRLDDAGRVVEIKEKQRISPYCTLGAYYFRTCQLYEDLYHEYYDVPRDDLVNGEKYIAPLYDYLLSKGGDIYISDIAPERVHVLGTPEELEAFLKEGDA